MSRELTIYDYLYLSEKDFNNIALKENHVRWLEECEFAKQAISRSEHLSKCIPWTIQDAIKNVASIGITLNPALRLAYLIPEYSKALKGYECILRISYQGLVRLATDCGVIRLAKAEIVKENDDFIYNGMFAIPDHKIIKPFHNGRGATVGVYCVAELASGGYMTDLMDLEEINKCMAVAKKKEVWNAWYEEMAKKSMLKRAEKQWPKSNGADRLARAVAYDNEQEGGDFTYVPQEASPPPEPPKLNYCPQDSFLKRFDQWKAAIENGTRTHDEWRATIRSKGFEISDEQEKAIKSIKAPIQGEIIK